MRFSFPLAIDGPYIRYLGDRIELTSVGISNLSVEEIRPRYLESKEEAFTVWIDSEEGRHFSVRLHERFLPVKDFYKQPERLLAISDLEGNMYALRRILVGTGVMNEDYKWTFGTGHLVILGDLFDRGENVTACLWLLYKLEKEAANFGGCLHFIMGNHENMILRGDDRYALPKYKIMAGAMGFSINELYGKDTELGRWLRTKNCAVKIGSSVFVHGGLSDEIAGSGLLIPEINRLAREFYGCDLRLAYRHPRARCVFDVETGPLWYRGYFGRSLTEAQLDCILETYEADRVIVGHTVMKTVTSLYGGKVIALDMRHPHSPEEGVAVALWVENGRLSVIDETGKTSAIVSRII